MLTLILIGWLGFLGMSLFFPLFVYFCKKMSNTEQPHQMSRLDDLNSSPRIAILIPACNEQEVIAHTLGGIQKNIESLHGAFCDTIQIYVGADGCTDNTAHVARQYGVTVYESANNIGKWSMIRQLTDLAGVCDWIILADAGVTWSHDFLLRAIPLFRRSDIIAVAPSYKNQGEGILENILWWFESKLKSIESQSGGPVSVHGATVCYRQQEFLHALTMLDQQIWLNDDVVLPLVLRGLYPQRKIAYLPEISVSESKKASSGLPEFPRRKRMVLGNIQWIRELWLPLWNQNSWAALLATRRVFRLLWAYWILFFLIGFAVLGSRSIGLAFVSAALILSLSMIALKPIQRLVASACASLLAPFYFIMHQTLHHDSEVFQWK